MMIKSFLLLVFLSILSFSGNSTHLMGGDITWTCQGGQYTFKLVIYRDCNGADINTISQELKVWGHPTVNLIECLFVSRTDISPLCSQISGGPEMLECGNGANTGNGMGAIERIIYESNPQTLSGTPPIEGWVFSYEDFSRSNSVTNLIDPATKGITLLAKMFSIPNTPSGCIDNSPQFLQDPYFISCVGDNYEYNINAVDPDLDSIHIDFGIPYDYLNGANYVPGLTPSPLDFEIGFSYNSPLPSSAMSPTNILAQLNPNSGNLTFLCNNSGSFNVKLTVKSYRSGILISEVEREMLLIITNCSGANNKPVINGPFGGLFETSINAGDLINFNLSSSDIELLQNGVPQENILSASGLMFGTNYTSNTGCITPPCATLDNQPLITMNQGVTTNFNWQTSCNHLVTQNGIIEDQIPYHFVFKIKDNYCSVPKVNYATITINVNNPGIISAPQINCIETNNVGDIIINWTPVSDTLGSFNQYKIYSLQNGLIDSISNVNANLYSISGINQADNFYISTAAGCDGNTERYSDTISNIYLDLNNPGNGTAVLQWNDPILPGLSTMGNYYHIYREYPSGNWILYDSVAFGSNSYIDTITVCENSFNYQIVLPNTPCDYTSNIQGDVFQDNISPDIPIINFVTIDTLNGAVTISWNQNNQDDTFGYIIYVKDSTGAIVELDNVFGIGTTSYTYNPDINNGPLTYSVAAFDSCWTSSIPPTYQTSAKGDIHSSVFLNTNLNICSRQVELFWTPYVGWIGSTEYTILGNYGNGWIDYGNTSDTNFIIDVIPGETYTFIINSKSENGQESFSNQNTLFINQLGKPSFNYLKVATVNNKKVDLKLYIDTSSNISEVSFQRLENSSFKEVNRVTVTSNQMNFRDENVNVNDYFYTYRAQVIDSCGQLSDTSNEAQTILLSINNDEISKINYLNWTEYREYDGSILGYNIYRIKDGLYSSSPIASVGPNIGYYIDDVNELSSKGKFCYYVEAIESMNTYNFSEISKSNEACITLPPLIYIPNAFTPEGVNPIFIPILNDFDPINYDFSIFNHLGQVIFRTNSPQEGWNGRISSSNMMANTGTYIYRLKINNGDGIEIIKRGHVTLLQ